MADYQYLQLEYAGEDRICVPIEHLERVQKHTGEEVDLTRLGKQLRTNWPANPPSAQHWYQVFGSSERVKLRFATVGCSN